MDAIVYQTDSVNKKKQETDETANTYTEKASYQMDMYHSVKFVNNILLTFYLIAFIIVHLMIFIEYLSGAKRNAIADIFWITILFLYPYLIYYLESKVYFMITYVLSLIYGKTYVSNFDKLLLFNEYYAEPVTNSM